MFNRRDFLIGTASAWASTALRLPLPVATGRLAPPRFASYPFSLGVASGDPTPGGMVLWTRLAPDPLRGGGMPAAPMEVDWMIAEDELMSRPVRSGTAVAAPELGHSVHVEAEGLRPDRWYWYQFRVGGEHSQVGRTRTTPAAGAANDRLRFGFCSCNHFEQGYFTAYRHMAAEDLDVVFHLGDYIYEYAGRDDRVRRHTYDEIESLTDYRNRYALYKADPDFQAIHAAAPFVVTWDDHEVDNNYAGAVSESDDPLGDFLRRRAAAYQAYYEHMPLRRAQMPDGADMRLYRGFSYGQLADFSVLDTRQYRTDQPCGDRSGPRCPAVFDEAATLMGPQQESWLFNRLDDSGARWNIIPQQVMVAPVDRRPGEEERYSMDQWSGYDAARRRLVDFLDNRRPSNPVVLTGDIHSNWVNDIKADFDEPSSASVATEFVVTSISSGGDGADQSDSTAAMLEENPFVRFFNGQRGYVTCDLTPDELRAHYRVVPYVTEVNAPISTRASFLVENGRPGARRLTE
jgi:alkaline phosphatase D